MWSARHSWQLIFFQFSPAHPKSTRWRSVRWWTTTSFFPFLFCYKNESITRNHGTISFFSVVERWALSVFFLLHRESRKRKENQIIAAIARPGLFLSPRLPSDIKNISITIFFGLWGIFLFRCMIRVGNIEEYERCRRWVIHDIKNRTRHFPCSWVICVRMYLSKLFEFFFIGWWRGKHKREESKIYGGISLDWVTLTPTTTWHPMYVWYVTKENSKIAKNKYTMRKSIFVVAGKNLVNENRILDVGGWNSMWWGWVSELNPIQ